MSAAYIKALVNARESFVHRKTTGKAKAKPDIVIVRCVSASGGQATECALSPANKTECVTGVPRCGSKAWTSGFGASGSEVGGVIKAEP